MVLSAMSARASDLRLGSHLRRAFEGRPSERIHDLMIEAILLNGSAITGRKVATNLTDHEAFALEAKLIAEHEGFGIFASNGCSTKLALRG